MRASTTRSRRGHPTAVVVGVLTAFVVGAVAFVVLGRSDSDIEKAKRAVVTTTVPTVTTTTLGTTFYTVQAGDSMAAIATRFGITVDDILEANELTDPDVLVAGQVLEIPPPRIPVLVVKPSTLDVGESIEITLTGAQAFESVTFEIDSPVRQFVGPAHTATKGGKVTTTYRLAPDDVPGGYTVIATGDQGTMVQTTFVVEAAA